MKTQSLTTKRGVFSAKLAEFVLPAVLVMQSIAGFAQEKTITVEDAKKAAEESQMLYYLLFGAGVLAIVAFSYFTSIGGKNKKSTGIGYRKHTHHHHGGHHHHHKMHRSAK
jgi:ABC-type nickel/cobalt efflux system permease component RcnA